MATEANSILTPYVTWFKAHERLVLLLIVGFFGVHFYSKHLDFAVKHDQVQAQIANQQAATAAQKSTQDDTANKLLLTQLQTMQQQIVAQNQRIDQAMQQRAAQTAIQKKTDDQDQPAELAARIHQLLGVGTIQTENSPIGTTLVYSLDAAHADADSLEDLQQSKSDVKDLNTKLEACNQLTDKQNGTINSLNGQITDGKTALSTEQKAHADDVKTLKEQNKRSFWHGVKVGVEIIVTAVAGVKFIK